MSDDDGGVVPGSGVTGTTVVDAGPRSRTGMSRRRRPHFLVGGVLAVAVIVGLVVAVRPEDPVAVEQPPDPTTSQATDWLSGAAGEGVDDGRFGEWRGRPVDITATWADNNEAMVALENLQTGAEFGSWDRPLDVAIGGIGDGETWAEAADGEYDGRWRRSLRELRDLRDEKQGTTYIRFAHEMNGNWYPWAVTEDDRGAFIEAWQRFRGLQEEVFPGARLVFCVNRESVGTGMDWRELFPGRQYVDVLAVDYYNRNPYVADEEEWTASLMATDEWGGPEGLGAHLEFARRSGLPLAIPEWSGDASEGDSPAFVAGMHEFLVQHGGAGPGEVLYEIQFNIDKDEKNWVLFDRFTRMPTSADTYQRLW